MNVYFVSGMSANCKVFDQLELPEGFERKYIEWYIPTLDETLEGYTRRMAENIDTSQPFVLVGYSFGAVIIQEMNKFVTPVKNIVIASMTNESEIPPMFRLGRKIRFAERFPWWSLVDKQAVKEWMARFIYHVKPDEMSEFVSYTDPVYTQWAVREILNWTPTVQCPNLYHIHGTRDQMFPCKYVKNAYLVKDGDHLMLLKRAKKITPILTEILLEK